MLYQSTDGTLFIDERDLPEWVWAAWKREAEEREAERMARNAERYRLMCEKVAEIERGRETATELGEDELLDAFATAAEIAVSELDEVGAELALEFAKFFGACRG